MYSKGLAQRGVCCWIFFFFWLVPVESVFSRCQPFCVCVIFCCRVAVPVTTDTAHTWIIIIIIVSLSMCTYSAGLCHQLPWRWRAPLPLACVCVWPATVCPRNYLPTTRLEDSSSFSLSSPTPPCSTPQKNQEK